VFPPFDFWGNLLKIILWSHFFITVDRYYVGSVLESGISEKYVFEKNEFKIWDYNAMATVT
jgi:hypothetical protein